MRLIIFIPVFCLFSEVDAQLEPKFYVDSEVRTRRVAISAYSQPMLLFRRIGTDLNGVSPVVNTAFRSGFNFDSGLSFDFNIRPLRLGIGIGQTWVNYSVSDESGNSIVNTSARYLSIPFRAGLVTPLNDRITLEVWPQVIYRSVISYKKDWLITMIPLYRPQVWSAGINIGSSISLTEYLRWTLMGVMDYSFNDLEMDPSKDYSELPIFTGLRVGLRLTI